jgi:hypothetical protein
MSAWLNYAVPTQILSMKCQHYSRGCIAPRFFAQLEYLRKKYPKYEAFGVMGYFIGSGRTHIRRLQKRVCMFVDRKWPYVKRLLQNMI